MKTSLFQSFLDQCGAAGIQFSNQAEVIALDQLPMTDDSYIGKFVVICSGRTDSREYIDTGEECVGLLPGVVKLSSIESPVDFEWNDTKVIHVKEQFYSIAGGSKQLLLAGLCYTLSQIKKDLQEVGKLRRTKTTMMSVTALHSIDMYANTINEFKNILTIQSL